MHLDVVGLEVSTVDPVNAWAPVEGPQGFKKITLFPDVAIERLSAGELSARVEAVLRELNPSVVAVHGYASRDALAIVRWAVTHQRPIIVMSASNAFDAPRSAWRECLKSRLLRLCSAGLAGGTHGRQYLESLGLPTSRVFVGYDVVDNAHFAAGAVDALPSSVGLSGPFFLASARFIEKKNLFRLLEAYALYRRKTSADAPWQLVLLGDGELRHEIELHRASLGLDSSVRLPGYKQYEELPKWYGAASCFLHVSTSEQWGLVVNEAMAAGLPVIVSSRCGCAVDLVQDNVNGFTIDPYDIHGLAEMMLRVAQGDVDREAMGRASREIISDWGPERFAAGLEQAVVAAREAPPLRPTLLDWVVLRALIHR